MKNGKDDGSFFPLDIDWAALSALSKFVTYLPDTRTLKIEIGASSATLGEDGTITLTGKRLIQDAAQDIRLTAAWIELN
jgi:hypothetical protein